MNAGPTIRKAGKEVIENISIEFQHISYTAIMRFSVISILAIAALTEAAPKPNKVVRSDSGSAYIVSKCDWLTLSQ